MSSSIPTLTPFEKAVLDFWEGKQKKPLLLESSLGSTDEMPVDIFFREEDEMPDLELCALEVCRGKILDIGAGAGCHSLVLQERGKQVEALEISKVFIEILLLQGVENIYHDDIYDFTSSKFDTLLVLMNGVGLAGTLDNFPVFLSQLKKIIQPNGQLLIDSSDINYAYKGISLPNNHYLGEIKYRYSYKKEIGEWFNWLYLDKNLLMEEATKQGWKTEVLFEDEFDQFLCQLTLK